MKTIRALLRSTHGGTAAEFGLLTPLLLSFMIGTIDVGRFLWTCNRAEKATQRGVRYAVTNDIVPSGLATYDFAVSGSVPQGDPVTTTQFNYAHCTDTAAKVVTCTCDPNPCPGGIDATKASAAFENIFQQMNYIYPQLTRDRVEIDYDNVNPTNATSGLGYAGDPNGIQVSPLVTVKLKGMTFTPMLFRFFGSASVTLPAYSASLTLEDGTST